METRFHAAPGHPTCAKTVFAILNPHGKLSRPMTRIGTSARKPSLVWEEDQRHWTPRTRRGLTLMNVDGRQAACTANVDDARTVLRNACTSKSVSVEDVIENLKIVREDFERSHGLIKDFPGSLNGSWRLVFAIPSPIPSWAYVPVIEDFAICTRLETISLKSYVGPFTFNFSGTCSFGRNEMEFGFDTIRVAAFGFSKGFTLTPKPKTYSFFLLDENLAAVDSSATGGSTLMYKVDAVEV